MLSHNGSNYTILDPPLMSFYNTVKLVLLKWWSVLTVHPSFRSILGETNVFLDDFFDFFIC